MTDKIPKLEKQPHYTYFEGLDLAGKTATAERLMELIKGDWNMRHATLLNDIKDNPILMLAHSMNIQDAHDAEILGNLYAAAIEFDLSNFKRPETNTIQDSLILIRTLAHHTVNGTPRISQILQDIYPRHPQFDSSFIFTANIEQRLKRLEQRQRNNPESVTNDDLLIKTNPEKFLAREACLIDFSKQLFHSVLIDTSNLNKDEVVGKIIAKAGLEQSPQLLNTK